MFPFKVSCFVVLLLISCVSSNNRFKRSPPNNDLKSDIVKAIGDMSANILKKYLESNNEAFVRFGKKIELIAERLLDDELTDIETSLSNGNSNPKTKEYRKMSTQMHGRLYSEINREVPPDTEI